MKVFIAVPSHDGRVEHMHSASMCGATHWFSANGHKWHLRHVYGCSIVESARDILASVALAGDWDEILWVDSDIAFDVPSLERLFSHPVEMVAGLYRFKRDPEEYPAKYLDGDLWAVDPTTGEPSESGVIDVAAVPFGFCRMSRSVLEKLAQVRPKYRTHMGDDIECVNFFDRVVKNYSDCGEDFIFCERWREIGGKVWVDPKIRLTHVGGKAYTGCVGDWLRGRDKPLTIEQKAARWDEARRMFLDPSVKEAFKQALGEKAPLEHRPFEIDGLSRNWLWPVEDKDCWAHSTGNWSQLKPLLGTLKNRRVAVQAGGCCGIYPALLAREFELVHTFEINATNFECLKANCPEPNIFMHWAGLSNYVGHSGMLFGPDINCGSHVLGGGGNIPVRTIDSLHLAHCDAIILDAEGSEPQIIMGAIETIKRCRPGLIMAETITDETTVALRALGYALQPKYGHDFHFIPEENAREEAA